MPNVALTKNNGLIVNLPADSVTLITSTALIPQTESGMDFRSVIITKVGKYSAYQLLHTAKEAAEEINRCRVLPFEWCELSQGDDAMFIDPKAVFAFDEDLIDYNQPVSPENKQIIVHVYRHDGEMLKERVDASPENAAKLAAIMQSRDIKANG